MDRRHRPRLRERLGDPAPLITGGRSFGARVACRTAAETGASAVLCLAFPEHPPGKPEKSRQDELDAVEVPVLVVQGKSDPFGMPKGGPGKEIVVVAGNHGLKSDLDAVGEAVAGWLGQIRPAEPLRSARRRLRAPRRSRSPECRRCTATLRRRRRTR